MNNRLAPFVLSAILPLFLFSWFVPVGGVQVDLLILWLVAMVLVGLPMLALEFALSARSQKSVWLGMQTLTREADAKVHWRAFSGLSVITAFVIAGGLVATAGESVASIQGIGVPALAVSFGAMVVSVILSLLKGRLLLVGALVFLASAVLSLATGQLGVVGVTPVGLNEWAMAVVMALGSVGLGTGLFWFLDGQLANKTTLNKKLFPIWLTQLVIGTLAVVVHSFGMSDMAKLGGAIGAVFVASFFVYYGASQLIARFGLMLGAVLTVIVCLVLSAIPAFVFGWIFIVTALLSALVLAIFAGYAMKISHLRKSLNFNSELTYNLWRIAIRWLVPLAIISAWVGWALVGVR